MCKKPLVVLTGPTAVGKTDLSIALAKGIGGEIISADSMQIYRKMNIGTAKIKPEEMCGVPHYLIDVLDPSEDFNVVIFKQMALSSMEKIYDNGHIPIIVGGTGFYIQALLYDIQFEENDDDMEYRAYLAKLAEEKGNKFVHAMLTEVDRESAEKIHPNNIKRVIRALEFYKKTGRPISEHNAEESKRPSPYNYEYFVLNDYRDKLYDRIDRRIDMMLEEGLVAEVEKLYKEGYSKKLVSMQGLGYKEILDYLEGNTNLDDAVYILKRDTRHFAKRQLTWFKRERNITMINKYEYENNQQIIDDMIKRLKEKDII